MDLQLLQDIGLTRPQALAYQSLVQQGGSSAPAISAVTGESRSNAYKILDKLCELGLAIKEQSGKKVQYFPSSPSALEQLLHQHTAHLQQQERKLKAAMPDLMQYFFAHSEQPGIRFYQGKEGMRRIYNEMLSTGKTLYLLRSPGDVGFYEKGFFTSLRNKRRLLKVKTMALTPDIPSANHDPEIDLKNGLIRTWLPAEAYTANVEWNVSGNKVALISYGKEAIGLIIESQQIAESFRQVFRLASTSTLTRR